MLTFLAIACQEKFVLDSYEDEAVGHLGKRMPAASSRLRVWNHDRRLSGASTESRIPKGLDKMHHAAHENCFIANSVKTEVTVQCSPRVDSSLSTIP